MPSFIHPQKNVILTTSLKVMYTTLSRQPSLRPMVWDARSLLALYLSRRLKHYMLTRDPYDRLVSFYSDKLAAVDGTLVARHGWQHCQRIFFGPLGLSGDEGFETVRTSLGSVSFDRFMHWLPDLHPQDAHLRPQVASLRRRLRRGFTVPLRVDRLFRMESELATLSDLLGLTLGSRENPSGHASSDAYFTPATRAIADRVYREDFRRLGYPVWTG